MKAYSSRLNGAQRGATLIVALILLLILTLVGVAGMQDTTLQEKMVGNMRDRNLAFQAAEAGLRGGEKYLQTATLPAFNNAGGLINSAYTGLRPGDPSFWDTYPWATNSRAYSTTFSELTAAPRYVVEEVPTVIAPVGESMKFGILKEIKSYRVTAKASGGTTDAVVILQSTYRRQGG
jgi:type IV pilus assembly protein PilX